MNLRHATALVLIAVGVLLSSLGSMLLLELCLWGLPPKVEEQNRAQVLAFASAVSGFMLVAGLLALFFGVRIYRRCDHRLAEVRDEHGRVVGSGFPILSPIKVFLFVLVTALLAWMIAEYGVDWTNRKQTGVLHDWAVGAILFLSAAGAAVYHWLRRKRSGSEGHASPGGGAEDAPRRGE
jgi:hypothetical protein